MHRLVLQLLATRVICVCVREREINREKAPHIIGALMNSSIFVSKGTKKIFCLFFSYFSAAARHACDVRERV